MGWLGGWLGLVGGSWAIISLTFSTLISLLGESGISLAILKDQGKVFSKIILLRDLSLIYNLINRRNRTKLRETTFSIMKTFSDD